MKGAPSRHESVKKPGKCPDQAPPGTQSSPKIAPGPPSARKHRSDTLRRPVFAGVQLVATLEGQVQQYRHAKFGPKSEKLSPAQLELALEDLETAIAETEVRIAAVEERIAASTSDPAKKAPRPPRKARALPESLPRVEQVIEPKCIACHCGCGDMVRIGEDRTERLDVIPARYQVNVTVRPKYACPKGRTGVVQARAPAHLLEGSWPTEALLAQIAMAKHSEHMPLNRQAVAMARLGVASCHRPAAFLALSEQSRSHFPHKMFVYHFFMF